MGTKAWEFDTHPFAGISHIVRTRNIFHNCHNHYLQGKAASINVERASILWKTVEKKGYEKNQRNTDDIYFDATDSTVSTER
jgi:hypothetical protein